MLDEYINQAIDLLKSIQEVVDSEVYNRIGEVIEHLETKPYEE